MADIKLGAFTIYDRNNNDRFDPGEEVRRDNTTLPNEDPLSKYPYCDGSGFKRVQTYSEYRGYGYANEYYKGPCEKDLRDLVFRLGFKLWAGITETKALASLSSLKAAEDFLKTLDTYEAERNKGNFITSARILINSEIAAKRFGPVVSDKKDTPFIYLGYNDWDLLYDWNRAAKLRGETMEVIYENLETKAAKDDIGSVTHGLEELAAVSKTLHIKIDQGRIKPVLERLPRSLEILGEEKPEAVPEAFQKIRNAFAAVQQPLNPTKFEKIKERAATRIPEKMRRELEDLVKDPDTSKVLEGLGQIAARFKALGVEPDPSQVDRILGKLDHYFEETLLEDTSRLEAAIQKVSAAYAALGKTLDPTRVAKLREQAPDYARQSKLFSEAAKLALAGNVDPVKKALAKVSEAASQDGISFNQKKAEEILKRAEAGEALNKLPQEIQRLKLDMDEEYFDKAEALRIAKIELFNKFEGLFASAMAKALEAGIAENDRRLVAAKRVFSQKAIHEGNNHLQQARALAAAMRDPDSMGKIENHLRQAWSYWAKAYLEEVMEKRQKPIWVAAAKAASAKAGTLARRKATHFHEIGHPERAQELHKEADRLEANAEDPWNLIDP